jgi:3-hydroxyisobutyrate dehydrogenase-like beta-hydroxyacid dehydrogenase
MSVRTDTIGFIGPGAMGSRMATRLMDAGNHVCGTNRTGARQSPLIDRGMVWMNTPREIAAAADITFGMVTDDNALAAISQGPDGILAALRPGKLYVNMSTVSPQASRELSSRVRMLGATMLEAPVFGSIPQAETGTLEIMVGGDREAFATALPLLRELGQTVTYIGPNGQAVLLKLAINISLAVQTLVFSEGLLLAERDGIDPELAATLMGASPIGSPMLNARIRLLLAPPQDAWFDIELMHKDIRLARQAANESDTPWPSARLADEVLSRASELGYAHRDVAALHEVLSRATSEIEGRRYVR